MSIIEDENKALDIDTNINSEPISADISPNNKPRAFKRRKTKSKGKKITSSVIRDAKSAVDSANPLNKKADTKKAEDMGVESLRLGYTSLKKTTSTVKSTGKAIKIIYKAPIKTVKATVTVIRLAKDFVINTIALFMNPIFWMIVGFILICCMTITSCFIIFGGGISSTKSNQVAYGSAGGVENIDTAYAEAVGFFDNAFNSKQNEFNQMIDSLYYNTEDLKHADLVTMKQQPDNIEYSKSLATDSRKSELKNCFSNTYSADEIIALVYVYLEKQANDENGTEGQIYQVQYTQEVFDEICKDIVTWSDTKAENQECPQKNCSIKIEYIPNPKYDEIDSYADTAYNAYIDWEKMIPLFEQYNKIKDGKAQQQYWDNNIKPPIDKWYDDYYYYIPQDPDTNNNGRNYYYYLIDYYNAFVEELNRTPQTIEQRSTSCDNIHTLHNIELNFRSIEDIMSEWGFTETYTQWYEVTYEGFQNMGLTDKE